MHAHDGEPRSGDGGVVLAGARVVTPAGTLRSGWVAVRSGAIAAVGQGPPAADGSPVQDLGGAWLVPGFVDMHVHGGGAWLASPEPARAIGVGERTGSIEPGKAADLVVLDDALAVTAVMAGGRWVRRQAPPRQLPAAAGTS